jgi:SH3-like domain-containing protein
MLSERGLAFYDSLTVLPDTTSDRIWGLVTISVCNMRENPSQDAELISQAIMGTPVRIIKTRGGWVLIQTPDYYLGWTEDESVQVMTISEMSAWKESDRIIFLEKYGDIFAGVGTNRVVSDIVAGSIVELRGSEKNMFQIRLPDGREGYLPEDICAPFPDWAKSASPIPGKLTETAYRFMGSPYLWGGTSSKGMDCSGFVKTVFQLNGIILARDVSLQYRHVDLSPPDSFPENVKTGDLLFFGSFRNNKPRPTHVGIYIGNTEFIHCSGMVRINSLDSTRANFSRYRRNTFLGSGKLTGLAPGPGRQAISQHPWYN